jgi:hypothetical protein
MPSSQGIRSKKHNVEAQRTPTRSACVTGRLPIRTGNGSVQVPGQGHYGFAPWENTPGELFPDAGCAPASFGKWHLGDIEGRQPTPQFWESVKVWPLTPVDDFNLRTRPLLVQVMRRLDHVRPEAAIAGLLPDTGEVPNPGVEHLEQ